MNESARLAEAEEAAGMPFSMDGATVENERRPTKVVFSARIPAEYSEEIASEADRCGQTPSQVIADLVVEALVARRETNDVMVSATDIRKLLATAAHRQAA